MGEFHAKCTKRTHISGGIWRLSNGKSGFHGEKPVMLEYDESNLAFSRKAV
jgi:hypothetical protein